MKKFFTTKLFPKLGRLLGVNGAMWSIYYFTKRNVLEQNILYNHDKGVTVERYCNNDIIVSLTTFGERINDVHLTIESLMEQTMKANRIILWLGLDFQGKRLPQALTNLQSRGLEIEYCKDIRSYTKLVPALRKYPEEAIITVDDDVIYNFDFLENLITPYIEDPTFIYCHRYHRMLFDKKGNLLPYNKWKWNQGTIDSNINMFPTGVGGVLYPPHSLAAETCDESVFLDICKFADDIWFKAMAIKKGTLPKCVFNHNKEGMEYLFNPALSEVGLHVVNTRRENMNDSQIKAVFERYNLYDMLR